MAKLSGADAIHPGYGKWRSKSIGLGLPIFPQFDRESRLAFEQNSNRIVEFTNTSDTESIEFIFPSEFEQCPNIAARVCQKISQQTVKPKKRIWIKVPHGSKHKVEVVVNENRFTITLLEYVFSKWHMVTV